MPKYQKSYVGIIGVSEYLWMLHDKESFVQVLQYSNSHKVFVWFE